MVVYISVLEGKVFIIDFDYSTMESIIISEIFQYVTKCTVDLVISLSVMMFISNAGPCSHASCVCSADVTISDSILFNLLSV